MHRSRKKNAYVVTHNSIIPVPDEFPVISFCFLCMCIPQIYTLVYSAFLLIFIKIIFHIIKPFINAILMVAKHSTALSTINLASWVVEMIKNLPEVQETWVQSLDWEDPLEKGMATHSSTLAWRIPWTEESGGLQSMGWQRVRHDRATNTHTYH